MDSEREIVEERLLTTSDTRAVHARNVSVGAGFWAETRQPQALAPALLPSLAAGCEIKDLTDAEITAALYA